MREDRSKQLCVALTLLIMAIAVSPLFAQECATLSEIDFPSRNSIEGAVSHYFQLAAQGNIAELQKASTPDFQSVSSVVSENKAAFTGTPSLHLMYLLSNTGARTTDSGRSAEFFCGVFNSPDHVGFNFPSLSAGKFAVVIEDVTNSETPYMISWILQQVDGQWKIAGLIPRPTQAVHHDYKWYWQQARNFKQQGQLLNSYLYYGLADQLSRPFNSMSTPGLDRLSDEWQQVMSADIPANGAVDLVAAGAIYKITQIYALPVGDTLDVIVKYQAADISDAAKTYQDNLNVIKALVAKHPELRSSFGGVVARAVAPTGQDYGTLLAMRDVK